MRLFEFKVTESFTSVYDYTWLHKNSGWSNEWKGGFNSAAGNVELTAVEEDTGRYEIIFGVGGDTGITEKGDAFRIFATVIAMIAEFAQEAKPFQIKFEAQKAQKNRTDWRGKGKARSSIYTKLIDRFISDDYEVEVDDRRKFSTVFYLIRKS